MPIRSFVALSILFTLMVGSPVAGGTSLSAGDRDALLLALEDERKAEATYRATLDGLGEIMPFAHIVEAEGRHISHLLPYFDRVDLDVPPNPFEPSTLEAESSREKACTVALEAEVDNVALYDRLLETLEDEALRATFEQLRWASAERHIPAFQRCVEGRGGYGRGPGMGSRGRGRGAGNGMGPGRGGGGPRTAAGETGPGRGCGPGAQRTDQTDQQASCSRTCPCKRSRRR